MIELTAIEQSIILASGADRTGDYSPDESEIGLPLSTKRRRYLRAVRHLENIGLITVHNIDGDNLSIQLTESGTAARRHVQTNWQKWAESEAARLNRISEEQQHRPRSLFDAFSDDDDDGE